MRSRILASSAIALGLLAGAAGKADAAQNLRVQLDQKGDFIMIGAPLGHDCANVAGSVLVGTVGACGNNTADHAFDVAWRADAPAAGGAQANTGISVANARSTAQLNIPAGATVTHAYLYWTATLAAAGVDGTATLSREGGFTSPVTATTTYTSNNFSYQAVADVTPLVQANGSGGYRVSGVNFINPNNVDSTDLFAGWWMVVLYENPGDPLRNLAIFDGLDVVQNNAPQTVNLNGFLVPVAGSNAKLGVVTFEGDNQITGDRLFVNPSVVPNPPLAESLTTGANNPANNFFNSSRTFFNTAVTTVGDLPQLSGVPQSMSGMDIDVVDIQAKVQPLDSQAVIHATSTGDVYFLAGFVTSVATFKPDFSTSQKTAVDLNGGVLLPGDVIEYTVVVTNTGNDTSINTVMTDAIPNGITYIPGSLQVTAGANTGAKTDPADADQGEYDGASRTITVRLGTGADGAQGGTMIVGETTTIKFQVTVDANISGTISNLAIINGAGMQGWPNSATPTDENGAGNGDPTDVIVEGCVDDTGCLMPTPYCNVVADPNTCVECLDDTQCPGTLPTCSPVSNTCICINGGADVCDNKDNDCNGVVDDGFGTGVACMVGQGICIKSGTIVCTGANTTGCSVSAGEPQPEVCNGLDDSCDGVTDEGFNLGAACTNGLLGACLANGVIACDAMGGAACNAPILMGTPEICGDGIDNDCDGEIDNGCGPDTDGDGILDDQEVLIGTDPNDPDSDDDGVEDGQEPQVGADTDGDGLINGLDPDSDNDGLYDGTELGKDCSGPGTDVGANHCIPDGDGGNTTTDPLDPDTDNGGVTDGSEDWNKNGVVDGGETDPTPGNGGDDNQNMDTDGDGLSDGFEGTIGSDPNDPDTDDDGVTDGQEANPADDTDGDGLINVLDPDADNDGLYDGTETGHDCNGPGTDAGAGHCIPDGDNGSTTTSSVDPDTDNGGIKDGSEDTDKDGVIDAGETDPTTGHGADDSQNMDTDGDGLSDKFEGTIGTDPNDPDTDDDGVTDGAEPNPADDTDGDGLINALDSDSDNDGLYDGTEIGNGCNGPGTDAGAGHCIPDGDNGATTTNPLDPDTDDGGVPDGSEDANKNGVVDGTETNPTTGNGGDDNNNMDTDGDGLSDGFETSIGTNPNDPDSDDDGLPDGQEPNPADDGDGDGLINALDPDTDNDGLFDGTETGHDCSGPGTDAGAGHCIPDGDNGATTTNPLDPDSDDGGVTDGSEDINKNGVVDGTETDPTDGHGADDNQNTDTDGDGLSDGLEGTIGTDPNDADTDDDGVPDGQEPNPTDDSDGDGLINGLDPDSDNDGLYDGTEMGFNCSGPGTDAGAGHCIPDGDSGTTTTDPLDPDTDDGGVPDGSEDANQNGVVDSGETDPTKGNGADDNQNMDTDGDGLSDGFEVSIGTNPNDADSDDDGVTDGDEANPADDHDGDGLIDALDPDSDNDGLYDGTEVGNDCSGPGTDASKMHCIPDGDNGATTTDPLDPDTDDGGVTDGSEDVNKNGVVDGGETDPTTGHGADDPQNVDTDGDGLSDNLEDSIGTDKNDQDSDDDGLIDGQEPNPTDDTDGDGKINALDPDSDNDGLFDGTELGKDCSNPDTDTAANQCIADGDAGKTKTSPLDADTDDGGVIDGTEDANHNGVVDAGETDPTKGHGADDKGCTQDSDCGGTESGIVCDATSKTCVPGCRGTGGNTCPADLSCSSTDATIGTCRTGFSPWGNGLLCSASPANDTNENLAWTFGLGAALALTLRRRQRASR